jgi:hypothetical protein
MTPILAALLKAASQDTTIAGSFESRVPASKQMRRIFS